MKIWKVEFEGMYPVGNCLVIAAENIQEAQKIAKETVRHTEVISVDEVDISNPCVIEYLDGDY